MVQHSADSLLAIIDDILDFSKIESGRLELDPAPFALRATLRETLNPLVLRAREKGLRLDLEVDPVVADALVGDAGRLRQVLINLVANAIKFTRQGRVTVTVDEVRPTDEADDEQIVVHFAVRDSGIGIPLGQAGDHLRAVPPGGRIDHARVRRNGPRPGHLPEAGRGIRRPHLGRERRRPAARSTSPRS